MSKARLGNLVMAVLWILRASTSSDKFRHKICTNRHFHTFVCIFLLGQLCTAYVGLSHILSSFCIGIVPFALLYTSLLEHCYIPVLEHFDISLLEQTHMLGVEQLYIAAWGHWHTVLWARGRTFPWEHSHNDYGEHCGNAALGQICTVALEHSHIACVEHSHTVPWEQLYRLGAELSSGLTYTPALGHCGTSAAWWSCSFAWELACRLAWPLAYRFSVELFGIRGLDWHELLAQLVPVLLLVQCQVVQVDLHMTYPPFPHLHSYHHLPPQ